MKDQENQMPKPSDFFLSIVTFLGVLFPGAVFVFLLGETLRDVFRLPRFDQRWNWVVAAVAAYVIGHILLTVSQLLNDAAEPVALFLDSRLPEPVQLMLPKQV